MKRKLNKLINAAKKLSHKKHHLDFIVAALTIPVLLSWILINYTSLQNLQKSKNAALTPTPTITEKIIIVPQKTSTSSAPTIIKDSCTKDIGPIEITNPKEGETTTDNPLCINIKYSDNNYCAVVWSYKINSSDWSEFTSNNPCIYNLPNGNVNFSLKIQSTVIQKEETITRNFIYKNSASTSASTSASM